MTHEDRGHYSKKHPPERRVKPEISEALRQKASDGEITCAAAHQIAANLGVSPLEVGVAADIMEMRIVKCQLGLYGYRPEKRIVRPSPQVSPALEAGIRDALVEGRLACKTAWEMAERLGLRKMEVSSACEALKIKITSCQLGAFR